MPQVRRPNPFRVVAFGQLTDDRLDATAQVGQDVGIRRRLAFDRLERCRQADALLSQDFGQVRRPVVAICQQGAAALLRAVLFYNMSPSFLQPR